MWNATDRKRGREIVAGMKFVAFGIKFVSHLIWFWMVCRLNELCTFFVSYCLPRQMKLTIDPNALEAHQLDSVVDVGCHRLEMEPTVLHVLVDYVRWSWLLLMTMNICSTYLLLVRSVVVLLLVVVLVQQCIDHVANILFRLVVRTSCSLYWLFPFYIDTYVSNRAVDVVVDWHCLDKLVYR